MRSINEIKIEECSSQFNATKEIKLTLIVLFITISCEFLRELFSKEQFSKLNTSPPDK